MKKLRTGGGCCGSHEAAKKKVRVSDHNQEHYPFAARLTIDGMTCSNCVRKVENALKRLDGVWAAVDLGQRSARVLMKACLPEDVLRTVVQEEEYTVLRCEEEK